MILQKLRQFKSAIENEISGRKRKQVHFIADSGNWGFKWLAHYVTTGMAERMGYEIPINTTPWDLRHQTIIFGNRYAWFSGPRHTLHPSNRVVVIWFHGEPTDTNAGMKMLFSQLPQAFDKVSRVIVSCNHSAQVLVEQGVDADKLIKIPLGVDLATFTPATTESRERIRSSLGIPPEAFCIGSFQKDGLGWDDGSEPKLVKGPDVLLETLSLLKERHDNLLLLLTGPARGYVKKGLDRLGIRYHHTYFENYHDLASYYHALDLYLISSRSEGGPLSLLEGWASGVPMVATRTGMPEDLIKPGENGLLANIEDPQALADHVSTMIKDSDLRAKCRAGGLQEVQGYDWKLIADAYVDLVQEVHNPGNGSNAAPL